MQEKYLAKKKKLYLAFVELEKYLHLQEVSETAKKIKLGNSDYEVVDQFCYLGDMWSAGGGAEASSVMRLDLDGRKLGSCCLF